MRVKMSKQPPPAPTASAVGPCPTVIQIVGRPGTGSLPSTIAPPDYPSQAKAISEIHTGFRAGRSPKNTFLILESYVKSTVQLALSKHLRDKQNLLA